MAFFDWDMDGKKDWQDDFFEYNIYKECMEDNEKKENIFYSADGFLDDLDKE